MKKRNKKVLIRFMDTIYNKGYDLAQSAINKMPNSTKKEQIKFARTNISESILKSYVVVGQLDNIAQKALLSETSDIKLSVDTIIKNSIEHPEIILSDYENLNTLIDKADYILQKNDKNIIYFKKNGKLCQFVIKTTEDKKENYVTTYHFASEKQLKKDLKRYKRIK